ETPHGRVKARSWPQSRADRHSSQTGDSPSSKRSSIRISTVLMILARQASSFGERCLQNIDAGANTSLIDANRDARSVASPQGVMAGLAPSETNQALVSPS